MTQYLPYARTHSRPAVLLLRLRHAGRRLWNLEHRRDIPASCSKPFQAVMLPSGPLFKAFDSDSPLSTGPSALWHCNADGTKPFWQAQRVAARADRDRRARRAAESNHPRPAVAARSLQPPAQQPRQPRAVVAGALRPRASARLSEVESSVAEVQGPFYHLQRLTGAADRERERRLPDQRPRQRDPDTRRADERQEPGAPRKRRLSPEPHPDSRRGGHAPLERGASGAWGEGREQVQRGRLSQQSQREVEKDERLRLLLRQQLEREKAHEAQVRHLQQQLQQEALWRQQQQQQAEHDEAVREEKAERKREQARESRARARLAAQMPQLLDQHMLWPQAAQAAVQFFQAPQVRRG